MRALHFDGHKAQVKDLPTPEPGVDCALIRVTCAGICDTDQQLLRGYMGFTGVLGHEFVGTVAEGLPDQRGQRVVGEINFACGSCPVCAEGLQRHCPSRQVMGILEADGAFAEYVSVPVSNLHSVPDDVPDEIAVFAEPLAAAFEILEQVHVTPGQDCLVLGDGKLGLLIAQVLQQAGARVIVLGKHPDKLAILAARGIETALLSDWSPGPMPLVIEATGSAEGFSAAVAATRPRGTLVLKSTIAATPKVDLTPLVIDEIRVVGSRCGPFPPALRALETGSVDARSLISGRVSLENALEGIERATHPGTLKILIEP